MPATIDGHYRADDALVIADPQTGKVVPDSLEWDKETGVMVPKRTDNMAADRTDDTKPISRFRPNFRSLTEKERELHDAVKDAAADMEKLFLRTPETRERSIAMTKLEEAVMWCIKGLTL